MTPDQLQPSHFASYPPQAKQLMVNNLPLLRQLPTSYVALLLREAIAYDWKFPAEQKEIDAQIRYLHGLSSSQLQEAMSGFATLRLSRELEQVDWVQAPLPFSEKLSAYLWATHQIDAFRNAATTLVHTVHTTMPSEPLPVPRLSIVIIGSGMITNTYALFRKLRPYGVHFTQVTPANGCNILLDALASRATAHPLPYAHWYVDGGKQLSDAPPGVSCISYELVKPIRLALLKHIKASMEAGVGSETLRTSLAATGPEQLGLNGEGEEGRLNRFRISILTEGSGTQIYSTTFVQWSAREVLRRAQPLTLLARFTPRQRERSMQQMLENVTPQEFDVRGSLIDADMGAYYTWINQERLPEADRSAFLVWFEDHGEALAIGPGLERGGQSNEALSLQALLRRITQS